MSGRKGKQLIGALYVLGGVLIASLSPATAAADVPVEITLSRATAEVGDTVELGLVFQNVQGIPAPELPSIEGIRAQYVGPSTMMSFVNGRMSSSLTHRYMLVATKPGTIPLGPFAFTHQGVRYTTGQRELTVVSRGQPLHSAAASQADAEPSPEPGLKERVFLRVIPERDTGFVHERIPLTIKLYVSQVSVQDVQYPKLEGTGYVHEGFGKPRQNREEWQGQHYDVITFRTAIAATREGMLTLDNIQLQCTLLVRQERGASSRTRDFFGNNFFDDSFIDNFFGRFQTFPLQVEAAPVTLSILPFPPQGRPADFKGAVGLFDLQVQVNPREVAAGDPVTVRMEVSGTGNLDSITSPVFSDTTQFRIYEPERRRQGQLTVFEQVIIPESEQVREVPAVMFSYFDPEQKKYVSLRKGPFPLAVSPAAEKKTFVVDATTTAAPSIPAHTEILGRDIVFIKESPGHFRARGKPAYERGGFWLLQLLPLMAVAAAGIQRRRRNRLAQDIRYARKLRAPRVARQGLAHIRQLAQAGNTAAFYDAVNKILREYLGHRFNRPSAGITINDADDLVGKGEIDAPLGEKIRQCFAQCDTARYASGGISAAEMSLTRTLLEEIIDTLERGR